MNRDRAFHQAVEQASEIYRANTIDFFNDYVEAIEAAGRKYKAAPGGVLAAQDACREEIEAAGAAYDVVVEYELDRYNEAVSNARRDYGKFGNRS
jgi:hypothetical protein